MILLILLLILFILIILSTDTREGFYDKYYDLNWTDPLLTRKLNRWRAKMGEVCPDCTYSIDCDYSDDALLFCRKGFDVPGIYHRVLQTNSY